MNRSTHSDPGLRDGPATRVSRGKCPPVGTFVGWNCESPIMSPFWASFFDQLRGCGRNATLFILTLGCLFILLVVVAIIYANDFQRYLIAALPAAGLFVMVWIWNTLRRAR